MKEAIEKAMKNGLFKEELDNSKYLLDVDMSPHTHAIEIWIDEFVSSSIFLGSEADLIFTTNFIDKLVGEGSRLCGHYRKPCTLQHRNHDYCENFSPYLSDCNGECRYYESCDAANYHRSQMANMTLDEMKGYIRRLI